MNSPNKPDFEKEDKREIIKNKEEYPNLYELLEKQNKYNFKGTTE